MSIERPIKREALADYSVSLQIAAQALWGEDFWGGHVPRPAEAPPPPRPRKR